MVHCEFLNGHFPTTGSTEASLPLEKEEQVRLQARKRLEEQLKQYRVKRQQERVSLPLSNKLMENVMREKQSLIGHDLFLSAGKGFVPLWKDHFSHVVPPLWGESTGLCFLFPLVLLPLKQAYFISQSA